MDAAEIKAGIIAAGKRLHMRGLIAANEGNISVRDGERVYVTAAGVNKSELTPETVIATDLRGCAIEPGVRATTEMLMHVAIYRARPDMSAIVHAHPPLASSFAVAHAPLDSSVLAEAVVVLGPVALVPYAAPGTPRLADAIALAATRSDALLLANHGAVTLGDNLARGVERMETLEQLARVTLVARVLGGARPLPPEAIEELLSMRATGYYYGTGTCRS